MGVPLRGVVRRAVEPLDPVEEPERRGLFERLGRQVTTREPWRPTLAELIGCHHSMSGFVIERMTDPEGFDRELAEAARDLAAGDDGRLLLGVAAGLTWGRPVPGGRRVVVVVRRRPGRPRRPRRTRG
jgi:hypothetical protein